MAPMINLSDRMAGTVSAMLPQIVASLSQRSATESPKIDLATAENWLLRQELVTLCKDAVAEDLVAQSLSYPRGLGGETTLLTAFAHFFNTYFRPTTPIQPRHIIVTPGASSCLDTLFYSLCNEGDSILVPAPYWNGFDFHLTVRSKIRLVPVHTSSLAETCTPALIPALRTAYDTAPDPSRVKALLFTNPHNPIGQCYSPSVIRQCMRFCQEKGIQFVSDEVYALSSHSEESGQRFASALEVMGGVECSSEDENGLSSYSSDNSRHQVIDTDRVHVVWSISKDFGYSGIRMACLVSLSNPSVLTSVALLNTTHTSSLSEIFTTRLLNSSTLPSLLLRRSQRLAESYKLVTAMLKRQNVRYMSSNTGIFVFVRLAVDGGDEDEILSKLAKKGVLVSGGKGFHVRDDEPGWVRICFAVEKRMLIRGLETIESFLEEEKGVCEGKGI